MSCMTFGVWDLDHRDVGPSESLVALVDHPGRLEDQQSELFELDVRIGDHVLDALLLGEHAPLRVPRERAFAHHVEGALHLADGSHRMVNTATAEPSLGDRKGLSERRNRRVDERRIQFRELLKAQPHRSEFARRTRFNENVGALDQLTQLIPAVF
jgi:hypothetical protein